MKNKRCLFTGHRLLPASINEKIIINLEYEIDRLIALGVREYISGGAIGFDQLAASVILSKRNVNKDIRLLLALPCKNQDEKWNIHHQKIYKELVNNADDVKYISDKYDISCMKKRNMFMVEHSNYCICALMYEKSGTGQTVRYAKKKGLQIINVISK